MGNELCYSDTPYWAPYPYPIRIGYGYAPDTAPIRILDTYRGYGSETLDTQGYGSETLDTVTDTLVYHRGSLELRRGLQQWRKARSTAGPPSQLRLSIVVEGARSI